MYACVCANARMLQNVCYHNREALVRLHCTDVKSNDMARAHVPSKKFVPTRAAHTHSLSDCATASRLKSFPGPTSFSTMEMNLSTDQQPPTHTHVLASATSHMCWPVPLHTHVLASATSHTCAGHFTRMCWPVPQVEATMANLRSTHTHM